MGLEEGRVVDDGGQQSGEGPEQQSGEELGDDGILVGAESSEKSRSSRATVTGGRPTKKKKMKMEACWGAERTLRYSTGLVTLNLSMVEMMMAGVVRKKSRRKRMQLMMKQRIHQEIPPSDRCSLETKKSIKLNWSCQLNAFIRLIHYTLNSRN